MSLCSGNPGAALHAHRGPCQAAAAGGQTRTVGIPDPAPLCSSIPCAVNLPTMDPAKQQRLENRLTLWTSPTQPHSALAFPVQSTCPPWTLPSSSGWRTDSRCGRPPPSPTPVAAWRAACAGPTQPQSSAAPAQAQGGCQAPADAELPPEGSRNLQVVGNEHTWHQAPEAPRPCTC